MFSDSDISQNSSPNYLILIAKMFAFSLLAFFVLRLVMIGFYWPYFSDLSVFDIFYSLLFGMRFDFATIIILGSVVWLWLSLPIPIIQRPLFRQILAWLYFLLLCIMLILYLGDIYYFGEVNRHTGRELLNLGNDIDTLVLIALEGAPLFTAFSCLLFLIFAYVWWRRIVILERQPPSFPKGLIKKVILFFMVFILLLFLGRGMVLKSRPIAVVDAFSLPSPAAANLALNGAFVLMKESTRPDKRPLNMLTRAQFSELNHTYLGQKENASLQEQARLVFDWNRSRYKASSDSFKAKNVVIILLESWSYRYIDALANNNYQATPFMDELIKQSQVWDRFYAAGQRSIYGLQAMLSSLPTMDNYPSLGFGLEVNNMSEMGHIANQNGYESLFVQTSERRSFHVDGIASRLGFKQYYGKEDIPVIKKYPQGVPHFGWDYDGLMFLHSKLDQTVKQHPLKPLLSVLFTGTTHLPYPDPGSDFHIRKHNPKTEDGYLNTLHYSDWALSQFMEAAKKSSWYKNAVFIFLADHTLRASNNDLDDQFHIPLIVFAPDGSLPARRHKYIASQYDIFPTLMDLIQSPQTISTFGRSLFDDDAHRLEYALVSKGNLYGVIHQYGWATFNEQKIIQTQSSGYGFDEKKAAELIKHAKWRLQHADQALKNNVWASKP